MLLHFAGTVACAPAMVAVGRGEAAALPPITEPFPEIHGANPQGAPAVPASPDPLVSYTWAASENITELQRFEVAIPDAWVASPPSAFQGLETLSTGSPNVTVVGAGTLQLDFGREHAAWIELESPDLQLQAGSVTAGISEYNQPWPGKTQRLAAYADGVYRLETNGQLYEGVRYAWVNFDPVSNPPNCAAHGTEAQAVTVSCPTGSGAIANVTFAEFGTADGDCQHGFAPGSCAHDLAGNISLTCTGKANCTVMCIQSTCTIEGETLPLGSDPCPGTPKTVTLQVACERPVGPSAATPWTITALRLVAQSKPTNYTGAFDAPGDPVLAQAWYTGAYGSRLNMMPYGFNSILMDRGDRVAIQGDGHPTMAAALAAFGSDATYELVHKMLVSTDSGCAVPSQCPVVDSGLMPYPLYWASSVHDWFWASGNAARFLAFAPDIARIVDHAVDSFLRPGLGVEWFGWDDRVGNGFCGSCNLEAQLGFAALTVRACGDFAASLQHAGDTANATRYNNTATSLAQQLRARPAVLATSAIATATAATASDATPMTPKAAAAATTRTNLATLTTHAGTAAGVPWYSDYGVHAASYLVNAKVVATAEEGAALFAAVLNNSRTICSWSPFNQYWILQALGNLGQAEHAVASIKLCWAPMLTLGKGCFWELFSPEWTRFLAPGDKAPTRPSYCHPWADGVTPWLSHHFAGVQPVAPGFAEYAAMPLVSPLNPAVRATVPTPHGAIEVEAVHNTTANTVVVRVAASVAGYVGMRHSLNGVGRDHNERCRALPGTIRVDGARAAAVAAPALARVHPVAGAAFTFVRVPAGRHVVTALLEASCSESSLSAVATTASTSSPTSDRIGGGPPGFPVAPPYASPVYPASWTTSPPAGAGGGDWVGRFGKVGYLLFAYDPSTGADVRQLPAWVTLGPRMAGCKHVGSNATNTTYLEAPPGYRKSGGSNAAGAGAGAAGRALGFCTEGGDGSQGTVLDVNITAAPAGTSEVLLTLYMVGAVRPMGAQTWSFSSQAIRVMDLATLDPVAMDPLIQDAGGDGVYWTLRCTASVRLRVMPIDSDSGYSALFVDVA